MHDDIEFKPLAIQDLKALTPRERAWIKMEGGSLGLYRVMHRGEAHR